MKYMIEVIYMNKRKIKGYCKKALKFYNGYCILFDDSEFNW